MSRISYLNGEFLPHENCLIHIEDRGFQFADGAYEVTLCVNGKLIDGDAHIERLFRSLKELKIEHDFSKSEIEKIMLELFKKNNMLEDGTCYMQVTRGNHARIPNCPKNIKPTINATVSLRKKLSDEDFENGFSLMSHEDIRWLRCDIKSVALFPSSMTNQKAKDLGFDDAVFVRNGFVTEGSFANIFIVDENDVLITKAPSNLILQGITRNRLIEIAKKRGIKIKEEDFTLEDVYKAKEVFLTSSSLIIRPATKLDNKIIGDGKAGKVAKALFQDYKDFCLV